MYGQKRPLLTEHAQLVGDPITALGPGGKGIYSHGADPSALRRVFSHLAEQEIAQYRILAKRLGAGGTVVSLPEVGLQEGLSIPS